MTRREAKGKGIVGILDQTIVYDTDVYQPFKDKDLKVFEFKVDKTLFAFHQEDMFVVCGYKRQSKYLVLSIVDLGEKVLKVRCLYKGEVL